MFRLGEFYEQILLFRRSQLRNMIDEENEALEEREDQLRFFVNSEEREFAKKKEKQSKKKLTSCPRSLIKIIFPGVLAAGNLPVVS